MDTQPLPLAELLTRQTSFLDEDYYVDDLECEKLVEQSCKFFDLERSTFNVEFVQTLHTHVDSESDLDSDVDSDSDSDSDDDVPALNSLNREKGKERAVTPASSSTYFHPLVDYTSDSDELNDDDSDVENEDGEGDVEERSSCVIGCNDIYNICTGIPAVITLQNLRKNSEELAFHIAKQMARVKIHSMKHLYYFGIDAPWEDAVCDTLALVSNATNFTRNSVSATTLLERYIEYFANKHDILGKLNVLSGENAVFDLGKEIAPLRLIELLLSQDAIFSTPNDVVEFLMNSNKKFTNCVLYGDGNVSFGKPDSFIRTPLDDLRDEYDFPEVVEVM